MNRGVAIAARELVKTYAGGRVSALCGVSLDIEPGEWVAITGPTGAGKSTLLALVALLDTPDGGSLELDGCPAPALQPAERWRALNVGIVFQLHHLLPHLTLLENVAMPLVGCGWTWMSAVSRAREGLAAMGLEHRADVLSVLVSGGERQLAAVARALATKPRLVLADEPTGNVDPATGGRIVEVLERWRAASGATLVTVTHQPALSQRADRVIHLVEGRVDGSARTGAGGHSEET
ncbi:MAG: ABC transporter ATP-binding protein [Thermoanaerobaculaceae bacterium]